MREKSSRNGVEGAEEGNGSWVDEDEEVFLSLLSLSCDSFDEHVDRREY